MKKLLVHCLPVFLAFLFNAKQSYSQCSTLTCQTPQYSDNAPGACILPSPDALNCYYGTTIPSIPQSFPPFWCTTIENNQWFAFVADETTAMFDISVYDCSAGSGIQAAVVYTTDDCVNFNFVSPCLGNIQSGTSQILFASNLTPGQVYFLTIDGNAGAVCDFMINGAKAEAPDPIYPADGQTGVELDVLLKWTSVSAANYYLLDVATTSNFSGGFIVMGQDVIGTSFLLEGLDPKTVYYWRLTSVGNCLTGGFSEVFAFQTGLVQCDQEFRSTDIPKSIDVPVDSFGTTWAVSNITVQQNKPILGAKISLEFEHPRTGDLSAYLVSPDNDTVQLFDRPGVPATQFGCEEDNGMLTFDDGAAQTAAALEAQCEAQAPALSGTFQPTVSLSVLLDKNAMGQWQLGMLDHEADEPGGSITNWSLQFCFFEKAPDGQLLVNKPLEILAGTTGTISSSLLQAAVTPPASQGLFTLLTIPEYGMLHLNGGPLGPGSTFTQEDIDNGKLTYTHDGNNSATYDLFHFDVIDQSNCAWVHNAVFFIDIFYNNLMATAMQTQGILCHNDSTGVIKVSATGLNGIYTYSLNGGPSQSSNVFSGLPAGSYTVVVTGQFELTDTTNVVILTNPAPLSVAASVDCNAATLLISGGTPPYTTDPPIALLSNLPNGVHEVDVTDNNGCSASISFTVNFLPPQLFVETDSVRCFGGNDGAITANVIGGCPPFTYSLGGGPFVTSNNFPNLTAGTYGVIIKDSKGNVTAAQVTIFEPAILALSVVATGDTLEASASGGIPPYSFSLNGGLPQANGLFPDLAPGTYTIVVTDAHGCTVSKTGLVVTSKALEAIDLWGAALSPNPGAGLFRLTVQKAPAQLSVQVFDMAGRLLKSHVLQPENGRLEATIDLQAFPNGNYLLLLSDGILQGRMLLGKAAN